MTNKNKKNISEDEKNIWKLECRDPGIGMDADSPDDFLKLSEYGRENFGISEDQVVFYWETNQVSQDLRMKAFKLRKAAVERGMLLNDKKAALDFEQSLADLQTLVERLENGELSLEDSLTAFEQGIRLTRDCLL